jgi:hypothetical protein
MKTKDLKRSPEASSGGSLKPVGSAIRAAEAAGMRKAAQIIYDGGMWNHYYNCALVRRMADKLSPPNALAQAGRTEEPGQTAKRNPALPAANCWAE